MYARTIRSWWLYTGQNTFETGSTKRRVCARPQKSGMHIKTSHQFFCHNSNRDTNLASNFLSEETAWRNIIVFARAKNVAIRLISLLFVKIALKLYGPANFDSVRWNIALHQTECPVKYFCLREVWIRCTVDKKWLRNSFSNDYRLCCVMENTEIWLADECVKISAISTWMSFWIRMNVILTRNAGTTTRRDPYP